MEEKKVVLFSKEDNIGIITLNDPPLNLTNTRRTEQFAGVLDQIEEAEDIDIVVVHNIGKYFGAGHDANEMPQEAEKDALEKFDHIRTHRLNIEDRISEMKIPFIAAMEGSAYGGAFECALACDIRVAARGSVCCLAEIKFGTFAGAGGVPRLLEIIGPARTMEHMLRADKITAEEWASMGVINHVVEPGQAFPFAMELAKEIASMPRSGIRAVKCAVTDFLRPAREIYYPKQQARSRKIYGDGELKRASERFMKKEGVFKR